MPGSFAHPSQVTWVWRLREAHPWQLRVTFSWPGCLWYAVISPVCLYNPLLLPSESSCQSVCWWQASNLSEFQRRLLQCGWNKPRSTLRPDTLKKCGVTSKRLPWINKASACTFPDDQPRSPRCKWISRRGPLSWDSTGPMCPQTAGQWLGSWLG